MDIPNPSDVPEPTLPEPSHPEPAQPEPAPRPEPLDPPGVPGEPERSPYPAPEPTPIDPGGPLIPGPLPAPTALR